MSAAILIGHCTLNEDSASSEKPCLPKASSQEELLRRGSVYAKDDLLPFPQRPPLLSKSSNTLFNDSTIIPYQQQSLELGSKLSVGYYLPQKASALVIHFRLQPLLL